MEFKHRSRAEGEIMMRLLRIKRLKKSNAKSAVIALAMILPISSNSTFADPPGALLNHHQPRIAAEAALPETAGKIHGELTAERAHNGRGAGIQRSTGGVATGNFFRGVVRAFETATISAELNARIVKLPFRDGDQFQHGDVLVEFDCARLDAEVAAASAAHQAHELAYLNQLNLNHYKAAGLSSVKQTRFEADKAKAELNGLNAKWNTCIIMAPFSGRVVERSANAHEIAQPNQPLLKIVNDSRLELILMVPSSWVSTMRPGTPFTFRVDETGKSYPATVKQIGGAIEPVSQSVRLVGELSAPNASVLLGMSGTAILTVAEQTR
jgi:membrane fusion protein, multidrug efflux system